MTERRMFGPAAREARLQDRVQIGAVQDFSC
jgi:hypothetical protein